jgi:hypothetical protein
MPHTTLENLYSMLGFIVWGDLAEVTIYRDKQGKMVWFPKTYPDKPPSDAQIVQRAKLTQAATFWNYLTPNRQNQWKLAAQRASLCMHGYDLWIHWFLKRTDDEMRTIASQTNTQLYPIHPFPP